MSTSAGTIGTGAAAFDQRDFRNALGRFATGIAVITTRGPDGKPVGLTANSFSAVSLDPPLILDVGQRALSHRFATPAKDKFAGLAWDAGLGGAPVFAKSLARFECRNVEQYDGGDHVIFVGRVERYSHADGSPLLFNAGKYGAAAAHPDDGGEPVESSDFADLLL
jgi:flavin reductase (DIM6/NTAB) family NADH-FMN oxidoreductase RutF